MQFMNYEERLLNKLMIESMNAKEQAKLRFGFYIIMDTLKKSFFVYIPAFLLGTFYLTLIVHISFLFIRQVTYGWHSPTHKGCILGSVGTFMVLPYTLSLLNISEVLIYIIGIFALSLIYFLGPIGTKVNRIHEVKRKVLRNKLNLRLFLLLISMYFIPVEILKYIITGIVIQLTALFIQFFEMRGNK